MVRNTGPYKIYKRERSQVFQLKINTIINGQRIQLRESTGKYDLDAAQAYASKRFAKLVEDIEFRTDKTKLRHYTLDQASGLYWNEIGQYHKNARDTFSKISILNTLLSPNVAINLITVEDISNFVSYNRQQKKANATINRYLALLSAIFNLCKKHRIAIPDVNVRDFMLKEKAENIRYIPDWKTLDKIVNAAAAHLQPIILFAVLTGLRKSNILNLKWSNIIGDQIVIRVKDCQHEDGKDIYKDLFPALKEIISAQPKVSPYIFTYKGERIKDIKTAWHSALKKSGLPYINFHTLRHTHATWLLRGTGNLKLVQQSLGHSDIKITTKYAHSEPIGSTLEKIFTRSPEEKTPNDYPYLKAI